MGNGQKYFNTDLKKLAIRNFREVEQAIIRKFQQYYWLNQKSWTMIRNILTQILNSWFREVWLGRRHDELWPTSTFLAPMHLYFTSLLYCVFYTSYLLLQWFFTNTLLFFTVLYVLQWSLLRVKGSLVAIGMMHQIEEQYCNAHLLHCNVT